MKSLEWRAKQLEDKILGHEDAEPICDQLTKVAELFREDKRYSRFKELYDEHKTLLDTTGDRSNELFKAELVLAYEDDLARHLESVKLMAEKADKVLDVMKWPDLGVYKERLDKLQTVTRGEHLQSAFLDSQTEELIDIYNEIIQSFRGNIALWNQKLEACEEGDKRTDE